MAYEFITDTGVIVADTTAVQAEVEEEYKDVFGDDLDLDPETPEGILISAETTSRVGIATNNAQLANQINPNIAGGVFLDALWALTGGARAAATHSTFTTAPDLTGVAGTIIPIGSLAACTTTGDEFETIAEVTLDAGGLGSVAFQSVETGAITCVASDLTTIVSNILGWETINNTVSATPGADQQSDISARRERKETLALQGTAISAATQSNVRAVEGVTSLTYRENITNVTITPVVPDLITLVPHSVWACVSGGANEDVAQALLDSKSVGANWNNGNAGGAGISVPIVDQTSGQTYTVLFDRPDAIEVKYSVEISATTISNVSAIIRGAIVDYANGDLDGELGLVVGADVSAFEAAGAISIVEPGVNIIKVEVAKLADAFSTVTVNIDLFEQAIISDPVSQILVTVV